MKTTYTIGEFSQVTGLSPKTLRFYHEKGVLFPSSIDPATGYRFYDSSKIEKARVIMRLREMEFSIDDISTVLAQCDDEADILNQLQKQRSFLQRRIAEDKDIVRSLDQIIANEKSAREIAESAKFLVEEKIVEPLLVAGIPMKGKYSESGAGFARLGKSIGRHINGKPMCLYYDGEYRDEDANFEPCFPIRKEIVTPGITIKTLPSTKCLSLIHCGPYDLLGRSYGRILAEAKARSGEILLPTREVYLKGPGMIFKGNPKNYLTEILLPLQT